MMKTIHLLSFIFFLLFFCFCSSTDPVEDKNFSNTLWILTSFEEDGTNITPLGGQVYNILFSSDSTFIGQSDCNEIGGKFIIIGDNELKILKVGTTKIYCGENSKDEEYRTALSESNSFEVNGSKMFLTYGTKNLKMTFMTK